MRVARFSTLDQLAPLAADWDRLAAGNPFRSWAWMSTWWRHYGQASSRWRTRNLYVLGVFDGEDRIAGIAPWYVDGSLAWGRVLRFLGFGEVCSEYLGILAAPGAEAKVTQALARWLTRAADAADRWDLVELTAVDAEDRCTAFFVEQLRERGLVVHERVGPSCWRIALPSSWEEYLGRLSRHRRKQIRRLENRVTRSGRVVWHHVTRPADLPRAQEVLMDLHQRRMGSLGVCGCFASARFTAFHREVMSALLARGQLGLYWAEINGRPLVAEYSMEGSGVVYLYQAGLDPESSHLSPGHWGNATIIRRAIGNGYRAIDFLRGDEPYKAQWKAVPRRTLEFRVAAGRPCAQWRLRLRLAGSHLKGWIRRRGESVHRGKVHDSAVSTGSRSGVQELGIGVRGSGFPDTASMHPAAIPGCPSGIGNE